jgi:hypothetical protein
MVVSAARFELALKELKPSDWERFERLSSVFLASDFSGLRVMASPGGDRGRDAELYSIPDGPNTLFQFSVRCDWEQKIKETLERVKENFPTTSAVVFMTSQQIGAKADKVRNLARKQCVSLDVRDRSWFVDRLDTDDSRKSAASELARAVVDPLLEKSGIIQNAPGLKGQEARTALVFLELQAKDDKAEKGLTKSCFESLVKAALQGTTATKRISRKDLHTHIGTLLPQHNASQLEPFVNAALRRLPKSVVKHYAKEDEFHISHEEAERTKDRVASLALLQNAFSSDVHDIVHKVLNGDEAKLLKTQALIREIIERYFYRLGEEFAQSVAFNRDIPVHADLLKDIILELAPGGHVNGKTPWVDFLYSSVASLLVSPSDDTIEFFRILSTAYTLFAFLSEVPDVQRATKRLFEHGNLWFDTTVLLPLLAEQAFPDDMRPFTDLILQLRRTGLRLLVTPGVLEEIERHLNLCKTYMRASSWVGRVPYVYQRYVLAGSNASSFDGWVEQFVGTHRPLDDLADFLADKAGMEVCALPSFDPIPAKVQEEIRDYWQGVQANRRPSPEGANIQALTLARHDTENYLSVLAQRRIEPGKSAIGYTSWLVTIDSAAWRLLGQASRDTADFIKHSPIISLDFLLKYLSFGPRRDRVDTFKKGSSRVFASIIYENIPDDFIAVAHQVRQSCHGLSERIVQRRIRDELDNQRMKAGAVQVAGLEGLDAAVASMF